MKKALLLIAVLILVIGAQAPSPTPAQTQRTSKLMAAKLKHSQTVLEGIAVVDFKKIRASAEELIELTKTEEWLMHKAPRYEMHSNDFRRSAEALVAKSKEKNIDGTTLAFFEMTTSCVRCHQHIRETRDARWPVLPADADVAAGIRPTIKPSAP
jgi:cytochrome c556